MKLHFTFNEKNQKVGLRYEGDHVRKILDNIAGKFGFRRYGTSSIFYGKLQKVGDFRKELKAHHPQIPCFIQGSLKKALVDAQERMEKVRQDCLERFIHCPQSGFAPYPYQQEAVIKMALASSILNMMPLGSGKSVVGALVIPRESRVLLICPKSMKSTWAKEIERWRTDLRSFAPKTGKDFRLPEKGEVVIITSSSLPPLDDERKKEESIESLFKGIKDDFVVIADEAHHFTKYKSTRTQRFRKIVHRVLDAGGHAYALTGTPLRNKPPELWCMLMNLRLTDEVFGNYENFVRLMGGYQGDYGMEWNGKVDPSVPDLLAPVTIAMDKATVWAEMPPVSFSELLIDLSELGAKARKFLDGISAEMGFHPNMTDEEVNAAFARLQARNPQMVQDYATTRKDFAAAKLVGAMETIEAYEDAGEPLVVACQHVDPVIDLGNRPGWAAIHGGVNDARRAKAIEDFQAGKLKGIAVTIQAGGTGLTLTAASHMIFLDQSFVPADNEQMAARIHRIGQTRPCHYKLCSIDHPLERRLDEILSGKKTLIAASTDKVKLSDKAMVTSEDRLADLFKATNLATKTEIVQAPAPGEAMRAAFRALKPSSLPNALREEAEALQALQARAAMDEQVRDRLIEESRRFRTQVVAWLLQHLRDAEPGVPVGAYMVKAKIILAMEKLGLGFINGVA